MIYGITQQGFIRKPYAVILLEMQDKARQLFGDDIDLSSSSPVGLLVELMSWESDRKWAMAEGIYYSIWLSTSEGASLDRVAQLGFVARQPARYAAAVLTFTGTPGKIIYAGMQASTSQDIIFETISDAEIGEEGAVDVAARCTVAGLSGNVPALAISSIKTPVSGVTGVINSDESSGGRGIETDAELRLRYTELPSATGSSCEAIRAALLNVEQVSTAKVFENVENAPDENGIPEKSLEAVVLGGSDEDIASVLLAKKPAGIQLHGSEEISVVDSQGQTKIIKFSRPTDVDVYITYSIITNSDWSEDSIDFIKRNAISYVGGMDDLLVEYEGVGISKTVFAWKLLAAQSDIIGVDEITVTLGLTPGPTESDNIGFLTRERPRTNIDIITVNVS